MQASVKPPATEPAELIWRDGVPESTRFGAPYFNRDTGLAEARDVFLQQNRLAERFEALRQGQHFVIAETGFGTGLNFLAAWAEWLSRRPADDQSILHFVSVERFPVTCADLKKALMLWPELAPLASELIARYPPLIKGTHRLILAGGRVRLTLHFGDVLDAWRDLTFKADAWFLDGFAPSLNPDMWAEEAIGQICNHSKAGTTLSAVTAVDRIREALAEAGFTVQKGPGFGQKTDILTGHLKGEIQSDTGKEPLTAIIGAGIAGTALAHNLAERGRRVLLVDQAEHPGSAASGNAQGALYVKLGVEYNAQTELAATALSFSQRFYQPWHGQFWHPTGLLLLAGTEQEADRQRRFLNRNQYPGDWLTPVSSLQASELAGLPIEHSGLWFPDSGWLEPAKACQILAEHPLIDHQFDYHVERIIRSQGRWSLLNEQGDELHADKLVIAGGHESAKLMGEPAQFRLKTIRGQVSCLPEEAFNLPRSVVCGTRYLNPVKGGQAVTGATFDLKNDNPVETLDSHRENLDELVQLLPSVRKSGRVSPEQLRGRVAFRCTTHDYQPVAGPFLDGSGETVNDVFVFTGLGSKGLVWAPLLAEYLADCLTGQPPCLPRPLSKRLETGRLYRK